MASLRFLWPFLRIYRREATFSLLLLTLLVVLDLALPRLIQHLIDAGIHQQDEGVVVRTALLMLGVSAVSFAAAIGNNAFSVRAGEGVARDLRQALFVKIQSFSFRNLDDLKTGQALVVLTSDVNAIKALVQISLRIGTRAPLMMIGSAILMVETSPSLVLALLPLFIGASLLIGFFIVKTEPLVLALQSRLDSLNGVLQENISGARLVKSLVRETFEATRFGEVNDEATEASIRVMHLTASMMPALTLCVNLGTVVVIGLGGRRAIEGELTLGEIVAFTNYLLSTMVPLVMMTMLANIWAAGIASGRRMNGVLSAVPAVAERPDAGPADELSASVELCDVEFAYGTLAPEPVLCDINLRVAPGETIAFLGPTGAGKSTLVQLIPRFYDPTDGVVRFGGHDVRSLQQDSLRSRMAIVPQESMLFSGTVRENICYGKPDASDDEVRRAASLANADEFIERLPQSYDAPVAARGANFSGGQRQRLAIARALLVEPDVLILDDSTSAVDLETEANIHEGIRRLGQPTTFVVAQRVSTVLRADKICLIDRGRIVGSGTHGELLRDNPIYQEIYESQLGGAVQNSPVSGKAP